MKKGKYNNKLHVTILYSIIIIGIVINIILNKNISLENKTHILKSMDETTEVANLNKTIDDLNASKTEYSNYITTSKTNLAKAITSAGVSTNGTDSLETMITNVSKIVSTKTSDATATAAQILTGKTAYVKGSKVTGTMANKGAVAQTLNAGGTYTIPKGYHNGSGKVTANTLASQTQATATANNLSNGMTAWVNGVKITGNGTDVNNSYNSGYNAGYSEASTSVKNRYTTFSISSWTAGTVTLSVTSISEYKSLTMYNFGIQKIVAGTYHGELDNNGAYWRDVTLAYISGYDASTGTLSVYISAHSENKLTLDIIAIY